MNNGVDPNFITLHANAGSCMQMLAVATTHVNCIIILCTDLTLSKLCEVLPLQFYFIDMCMHTGSCHTNLLFFNIEDSPALSVYIPT